MDCSARHTNPVGSKNVICIQTGVFHSCAGFLSILVSCLCKNHLSGKKNSEHDLHCTSSSGNWLHHISVPVTARWTSLLHFTINNIVLRMTMILASGPVVGWRGGDEDKSTDGIYWSPVELYLSILRSLLQAQPFGILLLTLGLWPYWMLNLDRGFMNARATIVHQLILCVSPVEGRSDKCGFVSGMTTSTSGG